MTCVGRDPLFFGLGIAFTNLGGEEAPPDSAEVWVIRGNPLLAVDDPPQAPPATLAVGASPNPFSSSTVISATSPLPQGDIELSIYDSLGRLVRRFSERSAGSWNWDGRDATGAPSPSGVFFVEAKQGVGRAMERLILIR